jgi:ATP-dependent Clp protease, protease subunit
MRLKAPTEIKLNAAAQRALEQGRSKIQQRQRNVVPRAQDASTIYLYDVIDGDGWGVSAKDIASGLQAANGGPVHVRINSPGGDVFEARAMATLLREYAGELSMHIDGVAASAATYVAISGDKCIIAQGGMMMIHNAWSVGIGDKNDMLELAAVLDKIDGTLADDYAAKCGKPRDEILAAMSATTWLTADESKAYGFADEVTDPKRRTATDGQTDDADPAEAMAQFDLHEFVTAPQTVIEAIVKAKGRIDENRSRSTNDAANAAATQAVTRTLLEAQAAATEQAEREHRLMMLAHTAEDVRVLTSR